MFASVTIRARLLILLAAGAISTIVVLTTYLLEERRLLLEDRQTKTQHVVEAAHALVAHFGELGQSGKMTQDEARSAAARALKSLRYGGKEYFWINDLDYRVVMHPTKPEMDGTLQGDMKDPHGVYIYREVVKAAKEHGSGFVRYDWPKPGTSEPTPKISYVKLYEPWGWVVGSGIYLDDIDTIFWASAQRVGAALAIVGVLLIAVIVWVIRGIARPIDALRTFGTTMKEIGRDGDLSRRIPVTGNDEISTVMRDFNALMDSFQSGLKSVFDYLGRVSDASGRVLNATARIKDSSAAQSADAAGTATAVDQMTQNIARIADHTREAETVSSIAGDMAAAGEKAVREVNDGMQRIVGSVQESAAIIRTLGSRSQEITGIVKVIKDIADQTNLLALNAAIEAARAGEQGRGFAVVADEVRKLAERSATATTEISAVINFIQDDTARAVSAMQTGTQTAEQGADEVGRAALAMSQIADSTRRLLELTRDIAASIQSQSEVAKDMAARSDGIARQAEANSQSSRDANSQAEELETSTRQLTASVGHFRA
ncbi:MAG: methyl-accepting chemotaxis protein [Burkholderiales bacterium]